MNFKYKIGQKVVYKKGASGYKERGENLNINEDIVGGAILTINYREFQTFIDGVGNYYGFEEHGGEFGILCNEKALFPIQEEKFPLISYSKIKEEVLIGAN